MSAGDVIDRVRFRGDPEPDPAAVVVAGRARFTVLTDRLIRLQWSGRGRFEDRASFAFPVRRGPVPSFAHTTDGTTTTVDTGALVLRWTDDGRPFHPGNLTVQLTGPVAATWTPGTADPSNLGGARRTVDDCRGDAVLEPGLVSRSGWAVHDDGANAVFGDDGWPAARDDGTALDWYFFGYGHDYAGAVGDYTRFGGAVPLVPRWVLGAWWSRYHAYDEPELREVIEGFGEHGLPLDVVVVDMDWHLTDGWTGYTWNRDLFPEPAAFLDWLHARQLRATLNLHPAQGVQSFEQAYPEFARRMGLDPDAGEAVAFHITDEAFVRNYFEVLHHPREDEGVDFWWMDWQQGRTTDVAGLDPLTWLNHLHYADMSRRPGRRPVIFSRWGGLGSHRYPVGFSGDSFALWSALAFQPRYTAAGANVGYGWWSHDIGGHSGPDEPELYVRWVQFGAVSPVLRLHSNNQDESERRPWAFDDDVLALARDAFRMRYELVPYLYTAARTGADTGVPIVRPTAWVDPEQDGAYLARAQYLLGPDLLVAPVVRPADPATGLATVDVWLPAGPWTERTTGERFTGPRWLQLGVALAHVPQFVRPGTVLPLAQVAPTTTAIAHDHLILSVFPGADGTARVFDDDGETTDPAAGAWTELQVTAPEPGRTVLTVAPGIERAFTVRFEHTGAPTAVTLDGAPVTDWHHDGHTLVVPVPTTSVGFAVDVVAPAVAVDGTGAVGPSVQVIEHTAPDEASQTLGRVVVGAPQQGPGADVAARWVLERHGRTETFDVPPTAVPGAGLVLDAPFAWDGSMAPARWRVDVEVRWGDVRQTRQHTSAVLNPTPTSWWLAVDAGGGEVPEWSHWALDPADIDFGSLAQRASVRFRGWNAGGPTGRIVGHAVTTVTVPDDCDVAIAYVAGGEVTVSVDGVAIEADVTGRPAVKYFSLDPPPRRTATVRLAAGRHTLGFACPRPPELADVDWYLTAWVTDADGAGGADGVAPVDVGYEAGDRPG